MKYGRRFWISWLTSSMVMFGLSYCWHGIILNDYALLSFPIGIFIAAASVAYLFIGALVSRAYMVRFFDKLAEHPLARGPLVGAVCGLVVYALSLVVGITFSKHLDLKDLMLDVPWQVFEQAFGGVIVGLVHLLVFEPFFVPEEEHDNNPLNQ